MGVTLAIIGAVGLGTQVAGQVMAANAQADASRQTAALKNAQADELVSREAINENILRTQEGRVEDSYQAAFAGTGRAGPGVMGIARMKSDFSITLANNQRDASFKAEMLRKGADIDETLASDAQTAGIVGAVGTVFSGATNVYSLYKKNSSPPPLYGADTSSQKSPFTVLGSTS